MLNRIGSRHVARAVACSFLALVLPAAAIGQAFESGVAVKRVVGMEYPWFARMASLQGPVELLVSVLKDGTVGDVRVLSGPEPLAAHAKETTSRWLFTGCIHPACEVKLHFSFVLKGTCDPSRCPTEFEVDLPDRIQVKSGLFDKALYQRPLKKPKHL